MPSLYGVGCAYVFAGAWSCLVAISMTHVPFWLNGCHITAYILNKLHMKKVVLAFILSFLFFVGCKPKYQRLISREFKQYVKTNFDNPNDLKEIVSISNYPDTINTFHTDINIFDTIQNKYNIAIDMPGMLGYNGSYDNKMSILSKKIVQTKISREWLDIKKQGLNIAGNILSDLLHNRYDIYYSYDIKARVKDSLGRIRLRTFYALQQDSVDLFEIKNHAIQPQDMPESHESLLEYTIKLYNISKLCDSLKSEYIQLYKEVSTLLMYQEYAY